MSTGTQRSMITSTLHVVHTIPQDTPGTELTFLIISLKV